jgi:hypothetical protein
METKQLKDESKFSKFSKFTISKNWGKGLTNVRGGVASSDSESFTLCSAPYCKKGVN